MLYIDIRNKTESGKVIRTHKFGGDVSLICASSKYIRVIEHKKNKQSDIPLTDNEVYSIRNWGN